MEHVGVRSRLRSRATDRRHRRDLGGPSPGSARSAAADDCWFRAGHGRRTAARGRPFPRVVPRGVAGGGRRHGDGALSARLRRDHSLARRPRPAPSADDPDDRRRAGQHRVRAADRRTRVIHGLAGGVPGAGRHPGGGHDPRAFLGTTGSVARSRHGDRANRHGARRDCVQPRVRDAGGRIQPRRTFGVRGRGQPGSTARGARHRPDHSRADPRTGRARTGGGAPGVRLRASTPPGGRRHRFGAGRIGRDDRACSGSWRAWCRSRSSWCSPVRAAASSPSSRPRLSPRDGEPGTSGASTGCSGLP